MLGELFAADVERVEGICAVGAVFQQILFRFGLLLHRFVLAEAVAAALCPGLWRVGLSGRPVLHRRGKPAGQEGSSSFSQIAHFQKLPYGRNFLHIGAQKFTHRGAKICALHLRGSTRRRKNLRIPPHFSATASCFYKAAGKRSQGYANYGSEAACRPLHSLALHLDTRPRPSQTSLEFFRLPIYLPHTACVAHVRRTTNTSGEKNS